MQKDNTWKKYTDSQVAECDRFCKGYIDYLFSAAAGDTDVAEIPWGKEE